MLLEVFIKLMKASCSQMPLSYPLPPTTPLPDSWKNPLGGTSHITSTPWGTSCIKHSPTWLQSTVHAKPGQNLGRSLVSQRPCLDRAPRYRQRKGWQWQGFGHCYVFYVLTILPVPLSSSAATSWEKKMFPLPPSSSSIQWSKGENESAWANSPENSPLKFFLKLPYFLAWALVLWCTLLCLWLHLKSVTSILAPPFTHMQHLAAACAICAAYAMAWPYWLRCNPKTSSHLGPESIPPIECFSGLRWLKLILFYLVQVVETPCCKYVVLTQYHLTVKTELQKSREEDSPTFCSNSFLRTWAGRNRLALRHLSPLRHKRDEIESHPDKIARRGQVYLIPT